MPDDYLLYEDAKGGCPVREYLDSVDGKALAEVRKRMRALAAGIQPLQRPYAAPVQGRIWEARIKVRKVNHRILFARLSGGAFLYLLGIAKQQPKVPKVDIDRALEMLADWERRQTRK